MNNAIEIKNLCKQYTNFKLNNVSFSVPKGVCCGFIGPNGAGKTTTFKAMLGMIKKSSGEIRLLGKPDGDAASKEKIGVVFDEPYFQEDWTPLDIEKGLSPFYCNWDRKEYRKYLSRFGLDSNKKFKDLSRGMKVKLSMAVNLSYKAELLLLDEPTNSLDPVARDVMLDIMREYMLIEDRTILFSTHITADLERIADMIVYISHGVISYCGDKDELVSKHCIVRGNKLPEEKRESAIGLREHSNGYECLMRVDNIGGLPSGVVTERATIDDILVYMERGSRNA